jgi:hypothetical protein
MFTTDPGEGAIFETEAFATHLFARHFDGDGKIKGEHDLGSGVVTNVGVQMLSYDGGYPTGVSVPRLANYHATGTGSGTAATDVQLTTALATPVPVAGTQSAGFAANTATYVTVGLVNYSSGGAAVTEWGLFTGGTLSATTGTPFTATSSTGGTVTGTPYTASTSSVQGETGLIVVSGSVYGLITSNGTGTLTIPAWWKTSDGTVGSTPGSTAAFTLQPVMWDHRAFSVINTATGDSIQFTYTLTLASGS